MYLGHQWLPSPVGKSQANSNFCPMVITKGDLRIEVPLASESLPENELGSEESEPNTNESEPVCFAIYVADFFFWIKSAVFLNVNEPNEFPQVMYPMPLQQPWPAYVLPTQPPIQATMPAMPAWNFYVPPMCSSPYASAHGHGFRSSGPPNWTGNHRFKKHRF